MEIKGEHLLFLFGAGASVDAGIPISNQMVNKIEELIGNPAPQLKKVYPSDPKTFFDLIIKQIKQLYKKGLIHGDLSAFNILNYNEKPYFIDFSQATLVKTPNSEELLKRDVHNIVKFFSKFGIKENEQEIIQRITSTEDSRQKL